MTKDHKTSPALEDSSLYPFRLGSRFQRVRLPDGTTDLQEVPLTEPDLLDPQLGDREWHSSWHNATTSVLFEMLTWRFHDQSDVLVTCDMKMLWGIPGLPGPAPDVAVIPNAREKGRFRRSFSVRQEGTRPSLAIEVVSDEPEHRSADHQKKVPIYERAGVAEYLIVDPPPPLSPACHLTGHRLNTAGRYESIRPDSEGRLLCESVGVLFGVAPNGRELQVFDAATGERLLTASEARAELARLKGPVGLWDGATRHTAQEHDTVYEDV